MQHGIPQSLIAFAVNFETFGGVAHPPKLFYNKITL